MDRIQRAVGAVVGSAVGDALGGPFEFGPAGAFSARFLVGGDMEMCGGGGWEPGEATDDTQMAVHLGESLLERGGLDLPDIFARFQRWAAADPKDIGLQTEEADRRVRTASPRMCPRSAGGTCFEPACRGGLIHRGERRRRLLAVHLPAQVKVLGQFPRP